MSIASAGSYNIVLLRSGSTGEYLILGFSTANLEQNILLYCPLTHTIIYYVMAYKHCEENSFSEESITYWANNSIIPAYAVVVPNMLQIIPA